MFKNWGFLLTEMIGLIIIAALLGLFVGWLIWARGSKAHHSHDADLGRTRAELEKCQAKHADKDARIATLEADLEAAKAAKASTASKSAKAKASATPAPATAPTPSETRDASAGADKDYDGDGVIEGKDEGTKPATLAAARDGGPDDLKRIKGIGPKLEKLCHSLGFYHFDQVAAWTADEVAWVDANLEGFKGRVSRDKWVAQAKLLAEGGETEFSKRVEDGDVY